MRLVSASISRILLLKPFLKKLREKEHAITTGIPATFTTTAAISIAEPQPKFFPATKIFPGTTDAAHDGLSSSIGYCFRIAPSNVSRFLRDEMI